MTNHIAPDAHSGLLLPGLDGANPLGFLAALGLFRIVSDVLAPQQTWLRWLPGSGTWIPSLVGTGLDAESLLDLLENNLSKEIEKHSVHIVEQLKYENLEERIVRFQRTLCNTTAGERINADWLAALASDAAPLTENNQLQTVRRDYYYGNLSSIVSCTKRDHLERAVFHAWDYADPLDNQSLHWDPSEDRRHAHQWNKPAGDPDRKNVGGMLGANRLAIEAIIWFYSFPESEALHTIGFTGQRSHDTRWTWPIWNVAINAHVVHSLLMLAELQHEKISVDVQKQLDQLGIAAVFRSARILVGKTPNFTPAQCIA
jgi:CRISPR-associated endonuclease/helicase Cas3